MKSWWKCSKSSREHVFTIASVLETSKHHYFWIWYHYDLGFLIFKVFQGWNNGSRFFWFNGFFSVFGSLIETSMLREISLIFIHSVTKFALNSFIWTMLFLNMPVKMSFPFWPIGADFAGKRSLFSRISFVTFPSHPVFITFKPK